MTTTEAQNGRPATAILLVHGPLREGLAASLTGFVYRNTGHIVYHDQYVDREKQLYFTRLEWGLPGFAVPREEIGERLNAAVAEPFGVRWRLHFSDDIINTHHASLPSFPGPQPYHAAYQRGVKIIGATSHYVTEHLGAGPIIEQDVIRVSHLHTVEDLIRMGRDLEKVVLARAIWHHIQRKILAYGGRTVIFG